MPDPDSAAGRRPGLHPANHRRSHATGAHLAGRRGSGWGRQCRSGRVADGLWEKAGASIGQRRPRFLCPGMAPNMLGCGMAFTKHMYSRYRRTRNPRPDPYETPRCGFRATPSAVPRESRMGLMETDELNTLVTDAIWRAQELEAVDI